MQFARMQNFNHCNSKMWIVLFGQDISHKGYLKSRLKYHISNSFHNFSIIRQNKMCLYIYTYIHKHFILRICWCNIDINLKLQWNKSIFQQFFASTVDLRFYSHCIKTKMPCPVWVIISIRNIFNGKGCIYIVASERMQYYCKAK